MFYLCLTKLQKNYTKRDLYKIDFNLYKNQGASLWVRLSFRHPSFRASTQACLPSILCASKRVVEYWVVSIEKIGLRISHFYPRTSNFVLRISNFVLLLMD